MSPRLLAALMLAACLTLPCCSRDAEERQPDKQERDILRLKIETARRAVDEIRDLGRRGRSTYATCETAEMLFMRDLARSQDADAEKIVNELTELCKDAKPPHEQ